MSLLSDLITQNSPVITIAVATAAAFLIDLAIEGIRKLVARTPNHLDDDILDAIAKKLKEKGL